MHGELLVAIFAGLGGMLGWGSADFFAKKTVDKIGDIASLVWAHIFGTAIFVTIAVYEVVVVGRHFAISFDLNTWLGLVFFGSLQALVYLLVYKAFSKGQLSLLNPIFASFSGLVAIFSILVFGEKLNLFILLALLSIFLGILLMNLNVQAFLSKKIRLDYVSGLKEISLATILAAIWTLSWDKFVTGHDWLVYALCMYAFMTIAALVISRVYKTNLSAVPRGIWKFLILIGLGETVAYLAITLGYSTTSFTSVVALLSGAFSLPTLILARVFLKENVTKLQTVGSLVIIAGLVLLSLQ